MPADIVLFRVGPKSTILDRLIGRCQKWIGEAPPSTQEFCHVGLVGPGGDSIIEARWPKVKQGPLDLPDLLTRNPIDFYRIKGITPERSSLIVRAAQKEIGKPYDLAEIFSFGYIQLGHGLVCSQYVWKWVLNGGGYELCPYTSLISPDDIASSNLLEKVNL